MATFRLQGERKGISINVRGGHLFRMSDEGNVAGGWGFTDHQEELDHFFTV